MSLQEVILVDGTDRPCGRMEKMEAHRRGLLHRAFSVFIVGSDGRMLLQQRALSKYHSGGLWTNACCSHPAPDEDTAVAARRRVREELGIDIPLERLFDFTYRAELEGGLTEHEFDHVFLGRYDGPLPFNTAEVMAVRWVPMSEIERSLSGEPESFTVWFRIAFPLLKQARQPLQVAPAQ
ncbi:MAG: hypothetical protein RJA57_1850, partial [Bacteroidota bacterium]|jgi:isopentenyl-diphosphate delta-isomerase